MKMTAKDCGDYWLLNGTKMWISGNGYTSDVGLVYCKTDPSAGASISALSSTLTKRRKASRGSRSPKVGMWPAPTSELVFEDAKIRRKISGRIKPRLPAVYVAAEQHAHGLRHRRRRAVGRLPRGRRQYANERTQFGQPIGKFQMIQQQIAEMKLEDEAALNPSTKPLG